MAPSDSRKTSWIVKLARGLFSFYKIYIDLNEAEKEVTCLKVNALKREGGFISLFVPGDIKNFLSYFYLGIIDI